MRRVVKDARDFPPSETPRQPSVKRVAQAGEHHAEEQRLDEGPCYCQHQQRDRRDQQKHECIPKILAARP
jgi:hypothetical protein